jgi:hypothetical protein
MIKTVKELQGEGYDPETAEEIYAALRTTAELEGALTAPQGRPIEARAGSKTLLVHLSAGQHGRLLALVERDREAGRGGKLAGSYSGVIRRLIEEAE